MTIDQKGRLIAAIISHLKFAARQHNASLLPHEQHRHRDFDEGDTFFALCFKTDDELRRIARLAGA